MNLFNIAMVEIYKHTYMDINTQNMGEGEIINGGVLISHF